MSVPANSSSDTGDSADAITYVSEFGHVEQAPEQVPKQVPQQIPQQVPQLGLEQVPQLGLEQVPQQGLEQASQQAPVAEHVDLDQQSISHLISKGYAIIKVQVAKNNEDEKKQKQQRVEQKAQRKRKQGQNVEDFDKESIRKVKEDFMNMCSSLPEFQNYFTERIMKEKHDDSTGAKHITDITEVTKEVTTDVPDAPDAAAGVTSAVVDVDSNTDIDFDLKDILQFNQFLGANFRVALPSSFHHVLTKVVNKTIYENCSDLVHDYAELLNKTSLDALRTQHLDQKDETDQTNKQPKPTYIAEMNAEPWGFCGGLRRDIVNAEKVSSSTSSTTSSNKKRKRKSSEGEGEGGGEGDGEGEGEGAGKEHTGKERKFSSKLSKPSKPSKLSTTWHKLLASTSTAEFQDFWQASHPLLFRFRPESQALSQLITELKEVQRTNKQYRKVIPNSAEQPLVIQAVPILEGWWNLDETTAEVAIGDVNDLTRLVSDASANFKQVSYGTFAKVKGVDSVSTDKTRGGTKGKGKDKNKKKEKEKEKEKEKTKATLTRILVPPGHMFICLANLERQEHAPDFANLGEQLRNTSFHLRKYFSFSFSQKHLSPTLTLTHENPTNSPMLSFKQEEENMKFLLKHVSRGLIIQSTMTPTTTSQMSLISLLPKLTDSGSSSAFTSSGVNSSSSSSSSSSNLSSSSTLTTPTPAVSLVNLPTSLRIDAKSVGNIQSSLLAYENTRQQLLFFLREQDMTPETRNKNRTLLPDAMGLFPLLLTLKPSKSLYSVDVDVDSQTIQGKVEAEIIQTVNNQKRADNSDDDGGDSGSESSGDDVGDNNDGQGDQGENKEFKSSSSTGKKRKRSAEAEEDQQYDQSTHDKRDKREKDSRNKGDKRDKREKDSHKTSKTSKTHKTGELKKDISNVRDKTNKINQLIQETLTKEDFNLMTILGYIDFSDLYDKNKESEKIEESKKSKRLSGLPSFPLVYDRNIIDFYPFRKLLESNATPFTCSFLSDDKSFDPFPIASKNTLDTSDASDTSHILDMHMSYISLLSTLGEIINIDSKSVFVMPANKSKQDCISYFIQEHGFSKPKDSLKSSKSSRSSRSSRSAESSITVDSKESIFSLAEHKRKSVAEVSGVSEVISQDDKRQRQRQSRNLHGIDFPAQLQTAFQDKDMFEAVSILFAELCKSKYSNSGVDKKSLSYFTVINRPQTRPSEFDPLDEHTLPFNVAYPLLARRFVHPWLVDFDPARQCLVQINVPSWLPRLDMPGPADFLFELRNNPETKKNLFYLLLDEAKAKASAEVKAKNSAEADRENREKIPSHIPSHFRSGLLAIDQVESILKELEEKLEEKLEDTPLSVEKKSVLQTHLQENLTYFSVLPPGILIPRRRTKLPSSQLKEELAQQPQHQQSQGSEGSEGRGKLIEEVIRKCTICSNKIAADVNLYLQSTEARTKPRTQPRTEPRTSAMADVDVDLDVDMNAANITDNADIGIDVLVCDFVPSHMFVTDKTKKKTVKNSASKKRKVDSGSRSSGASSGASSSASSSTSSSASSSDTSLVPSKSSRSPKFSVLSTHLLRQLASNVLSIFDLSMPWQWKSIRKKQKKTKAEIQKQKGQKGQAIEPNISTDAQTNWIERLIKTPALTKFISFDIYIQLYTYFFLLL